MTTELRVYLLVEDLQPQFAAYMSTPTRGVGYPPFKGENSLFIEVAPALAIHRVIDLATQSFTRYGTGNIVYRTPVRPTGAAFTGQKITRSSR